MPTATQERIHPQVEVRTVNRDNLTVDIVASTDSLDSYNSKVDPAGWDLEQFKRNPQILWAHDDRGFTASAGLPVAKALPNTVRVEGGKLLMTLQFTPKDVNDFGYKVFQLISNGFLNGLSVGFEPIEWNDEQDQDGTNVRTYTKQKLCEVSVVTIPANDDALVVGRAKQMNLEVDNARQLAAEVDQMAEERLRESRRVAPNDVSDERTPAYVEKCINYFENKQPINKKASTVLKKFYTRVLAEEPPADEGAAWDRMGEAVDAMEETKAEEVKNEEEKPQEAAIEEPSNTPAPAEAPQDERKASVQISLAAISQLPTKVGEAMKAALEEALRGGMPVSEAGAFLDGLGEKLKASFIQ